MKKFAAFDIDGTLIRWQLYHTVVDKLAKSGVLGSTAYSEIKTARMKWKKRESPESFREYEKIIIKVFEDSLDKISTDDFDQMGMQVIEEYKDQVYIFTRDLIRDLKSKDYFILAISGSHHELVELIANYYEFDDYIGSNYKRDGKNYSGEKFIASADKETELRQMIKKHNLDLEGSYAVGDSMSDVAMLKVVDYPIAFNPDVRLMKVAEQEGWKIVVERKDVIYQLERRNGKYILT